MQSPGSVTSRYDGTSFYLLASTALTTIDLLPMKIKILLPLFLIVLADSTILAQDYRQQAEELLRQAQLDQENFETNAAYTKMRRAQKLYRQNGEEKKANALYSPILDMGDDAGNMTEEQIIVALNEIGEELAPLTQDSPTLLGHYYYQRMGAFHFLEDFEEVRLAYDRGLMLQSADEEETTQIRFDLHLIMAELLSERDLYLEALAILREMEGVLLGKEEDYPQRAAVFYLSASEIYTEVNRLDDALEASQKAYLISQKNEHTDTAFLTQIYRQTGKIYTAKGEFDKAIEYHQQELKLLQTDESLAVKVLPETWYWLAEDYLAAGDFELAKEAYHQSIRYTKTMEEAIDFVDYYQRINICTGLADIYIATDSLELAEQYLRKALHLNKEGKNDYRREVIYSYLGRVYEARSDLDKATVFTKKALAAAIQKLGQRDYITGGLYRDLAFIEESQGNIGQALTYQQQAIVSACRNFDESDFRENPQIEDIAEKFRLLSELSFKMDLLEKNDQLPPEEQVDLIYQTAMLAVRIINHIRKEMTWESSQENFLNDAIRSYERAIDACLQRAQTEPAFYEEAFKLAEESKSVLLLDALKTSRAGAFGDVPHELIDRERQLKLEITTYERRAFDAQLNGEKNTQKEYENKVFEQRTALDNLQRKLEREYPRYYALKYEKILVATEEIRSQLDAETCFMEFFEGEDHLYIFTITPQGLQPPRRIPKSENHSLEINNLRMAISNMTYISGQTAQAYERLTTLGYQYYQDYLQPSLLTIPHTKRLIIIPDGLLSYIPFEVLLTKKPAAQGNKNDFKTLPYLIRDYSVTYNYSGTLWLSQLKKGKASGSPNNKQQILAMAAAYDTAAINQKQPTYLQNIRRQLNPLLGVNEEVDFLQGRYQGQFLKGNKATEKTFKDQAGNFAVLHLAMHGLVNSAQPQYSSLAFSDNPESTEDNFLNAYEIKQLQLNASMVVLSACETGYGKYQRGEGVVSIGRGFMYAGTPTLVMTLWQLNDAAGLKIIRRFYANLEKGMEKDKALQKAKLDYLNKQQGLAAHPAMWACFVQLGDYAPLTIERGEGWIPYLFWGLGGFALLCILWGLFRWKRA